MIENDVAALQRRVGLLERKVAYLMEHLGLEFDEDKAYGGVNPEVLEAVRRNNIIEAIKVYREITGVGLKEAKDAVEDIAARYKQGMI